MPVFDLETNDWTFLTTKPHLKKLSQTYPKARKCHSLAVIGNDCYICGGTSGADVCKDIWHINLDKLKWTLLVECIPYPVYFHGASISQGAKLTVFGGVDHACGDSRNNKLTSIWLRVTSLKNMCMDALEYYVTNGTIPRKALRETGLNDTLEMAESI